MSNPARILANTKNWIIFTGLCVRRPVVITPELSPLQQKVSQVYQSIELEKSYLSLHEWKGNLERAQASKASSEKKASDTLASEESLLTVAEKELIWESEADKFKAPDRITENDRSGNLKSAWRLLDRPLVLLTKGPFIGSTAVWSLPVAKLEKNQNLWQAANLLASKLLPTSSKFQIYGYAPSAVYVHQFKDADNCSSSGIQVYFFNAYVDRHWHGDKLSVAENTDLAWVTRDEMKKFVRNAKLLKVLKSFIQEY